MMVPGTGIEPVCHFWRRSLSPVRLPISPTGQHAYLMASVDRFELPTNRVEDDGSVR
jgi:hypothetical protein